MQVGWVWFGLNYIHTWPDLDLSHCRSSDSWVKGGSLIRPNANCIAIYLMVSEPTRENPIRPAEIFFFGNLVSLSLNLTQNETILPVARWWLGPYFRPQDCPTRMHVKLDLDLNMEFVSSLLWDGVERGSVSKSWLSRNCIELDMLRTTLVEWDCMH